MTEQQIIHYVQGHWNGEAQLKAICGQTVTCQQASSLFTNCPNCKIHWRSMLTAYKDN